MHEIQAYYLFETERFDAQLFWCPLDAIAFNIDIVLKIDICLFIFYIF